MTAIERVLATAEAETGYLEKASNRQLDSETANAGYKNYTKYARDLDALGNVYNGKKNGYSWCDVFVDWCFIKTFGLELAMKLLCQPYGGGGAGCTCSAQYYRNKKQFFTSNPKRGDQIFFKAKDGRYGHTGIVEKVENGRVYTIEGNTSSSSGVVANGGAVCRKSYSLNYAKIGGYGRPDWSLVPDVQPVAVSYQGRVAVSNFLNCRDTYSTGGNVVTTYPNGTVLTITQEMDGWGYTGVGWVCLDYIKKIAAPVATPTEKTEDDDMDVKRFTELWHEMRKELQDNDAAAWSEDARQWAVSTGLVQGGTPTPNGEPNYMWEDVLDRQQMVMLLYRFAKMMGQA